MFNATHGADHEFIEDVPQGSVLNCLSLGCHGFQHWGIPRVGERRGEGQHSGGFQHREGGGHPSGGFNPKDFSFVLEIVGRHELLPG